MKTQDEVNQFYNVMNDARKRLHERCLALSCFPDNGKVKEESDYFEKTLKDWVDAVYSSQKGVDNDESRFNELLRRKIIRDVAIKEYDTYALARHTGYWSYPVTLEELLEHGLPQEIYRKLKLKQADR